LIERGPPPPPIIKTLRFALVEAEHDACPVAAAEDDLCDNDKEGRLYARASTTCMIFPARAWAMKGPIR